MELENDVPKFTPAEEKAFGAELESNAVLKAFRDIWSAIDQLTNVLVRADERR